jgi:hypothetical protein
VCCSETAPAWLTVSLGALRPVAAVQLLYHQDLTFTLALANASDGPFVPFASRVCEACTMNRVDRYSDRTFTPAGGAPVVAASFVKMNYLVLRRRRGRLRGHVRLVRGVRDVRDRACVRARHAHAALTRARARGNWQPYVCRCF